MSANLAIAAGLPKHSLGALIRRRSLDALSPILFILATLVALEIMVRTLNVPEVLLPPPSRVLQVLALNAGLLSYHASLTSIQVLIALVVSLALGVGIAVVFSLSRLMRDMFTPLFVVFQIIPKIALAPLFVVWFGTESLSRICFAICLSFFPILTSTRAGLEETSADATKLCEALLASRWQTLMSVQLPMALPQLFVGAKVSATLCIIGVVLGEFVSAKAGIGWYIVQAGALSQTAHILAGLIVLSVFGFAIYGAVSAGEILVRRKMFG